LLVLPPATPARAELDLTLRREGDPDTWIRPTLRLDAVGAAESNAWAGNSRGLLGEHSNGWGEFGVTPGLESQLASDAAGTFHARVSGVYATTQFGLDAAGSNFEDRHPRETALEDSYLGWRSADLLPALGVDAIDLSIGAQPYSVGTGFLFADGATDGGERGAFWLGPRKAFRMTAIGRLQTGALRAEAVYLRPNDEPYTHTDVAGLNLEWSFGERATLGGGYWNVYDSRDERRDGLDVFDLRLAASPFADGQPFPGLRLSAEVVRESNGAQNDSWGGYGEVGYEFERARGKPYLSYRFAHFTGDDGTGDNESFDPLFYGSTDWGTWYLGEIVGEFVATNRNASVHTLRARVQPNDSITVNLLYFFLRLDEFPSQIPPRPPTPPRAVLIEDRDLAHEVDLILDLELGDHLSLSAVAGVLFVASGGEDFLRDDEIWSHYLLALSASF
jgi:hypothetical protein